MKFCVFKHKDQNRANFSDKKTFPCEQCNFGGTSKLELIKHINFKHEDGEYSCNQCDYTGKTKLNIKNHVQIKHEEVVFSCEYCRYKSGGKALEDTLNQDIK